ncbi:hypothetical protein ACFE04_019271 [Oxalis oulophora]
MRNPNALLVLLLLILVNIITNVEFVTASKRKVEIPDNLDDVIDDEEDEDWKEWGKMKDAEFDPPPSDLNNMDFAEIQAKMMKRSMGPVLGFVKLVLGVTRTPEEVTGIAMKWSKVLRTAAMEVKFWGVDSATIMFNMAANQDMTELKEFIMDQPEAYELKIGDHVFRRPGDPPLEAVVEKLQYEKLQHENNKASDNKPIEDNSNNHKDEL